MKFMIPGKQLRRAIIETLVELKTKLTKQIKIILILLLTMYAVFNKN